MKQTVRVGAVAYLNTRPLVFGLERGSGTDRIRLSYAVPSRLAEQMAQGQLDVALLPIIELAQNPELEIVPGLAIGTRGPSRSVLLVSRCPPERARRVALDPDSRTSNALARVLLREVWNIEPECIAGAAELADSLAECDAAVRIGDKALFEPLPDGTSSHDLGEIWTAHTGLPFVFAAWTARPGIVDRALYRALHDSRREGCRQIETIAADYRWRGQRSPDLVRAYLDEHIRYRLGEAEVRAMHRFFGLAARHGVIAAPPELRFALSRRTACHETAAALAREVPHA